MEKDAGPGLYAVELAGRGCTVTGVVFSPAESISLDRYYLLNLETGEMREITIADQIYSG